MWRRQSPLLRSPYPDPPHAGCPINPTRIPGTSGPGGASAQHADARGVLQVDEETMEEIMRTETRSYPMLFVRGDGVILISPPMRGGE